MKPQHKKIIAKEVIILASSVIVSILLLSFFYLKNFYFKSKLKNYTIDISNLKQSIDSVEKIPHVNLLYSIFTDKLYSEYKTKWQVEFGNPLTKNETYTNEDIININAHDLSTLIASFCDSIISPLIKWEPPKDAVPTSLYNLAAREVIRWEEAETGNNYFYLIHDEITNDSSKQEMLHKAYEFFYSKKYLIKDYDEFISTLKGIPFSAKSPIWLKYQRNIKEKDQLEMDLQITKCKVLSASEIKDNCIQVLFILLILIYPVRLFILLLIWAFRTLKENKNE
jgi:hypothetical protein